MNFELVPEIGRVGEYIYPLSQEQEEKAMKIHKEATVFDLHMHSVVLPESLEDLDDWIRMLRYKTGYKGIKHAGLNGFIDGFGSIAHDWELNDIIKEIGLRASEMDHNYDKVIRGLRVEDVYRAKKEGKIVIFICVENAEIIGNLIDNVDMLYGLGVRAMGLGYNKRNLIGDGRVERTDSGLSNFGLAVIERMNSLGMIVDVVHCGERTTIEALEASKDPMMISHSGARGIYNTVRLASDEELEAVKNNGGLLGIHSGPNILSGEKNQNIDMMIDHLDYCVKAIGIDHVCIGSDNYFGDKTMFNQNSMRRHSADKLQNYIKINCDNMKGIENPSEWKNITRVLVKRGYSDEDIKKLIGGNALKLLKTVIG